MSHIYLRVCVGGTDKYLCVCVGGTDIYIYIVCRWHARPAGDDAAVPARCSWKVWKHVKYDRQMTCAHFATGGHENQPQNGSRKQAQRECISEF